jgi:D-alanyl-D-alanine carboxypeptidase (penicillin-binding protein 5/6)
LDVVIGGRTQSRNLHFAPKPRRRVRWRLVAAVLIVVVLAAAAAVIKAAVAPAPALAVHQVMAASAALAGSPPQPAWPAEGQAAVEVEGLPSLGSSGPSTPTPIASLAKVMTAFVVLRDHPLAVGQTGFKLTVTAAQFADYQRRLAQSESVVPVVSGEALDEVQLLQGLLVASGNNFALILAEEDAGSEAAFVAKMQSTAQGLGMSHTTYTDPSGLESSTVSDASDQLILAAKAMADPVFAQVVALTSANLPVAGVISNFNKAVGTGGYVGVKTGSDSSAGGCLVFANRQRAAGRTVTILGVVLGQALGQQGTANLIAAAVTASDRLVRSVAAAVTVKTVVPAATVVAVVTNVQGKRVQVRTSGPLTELGYGGTTVPLTVSIQPVGTGLTSGQVVADVSIAGGASTPARAAASMPSVSFDWKLRHDY